ncbi:MAG: hypothetical protein VXW74_00990, partial [Candidatus Thermoplasmatota archaeon]|nr:hypothetical protein [Candidatus Thermoplasmatota archaeon]
MTDLRDGALDATSPLVQTRGIGPYVEGRLRVALGRPQPLTVGEFWNAARRRTTLGLSRLLRRALQNERANQCVSTRVAGREHERSYHTGDVNEYAYEALAALLEHRRRMAPATTYGALPARLPRRSP